MINLRKWQREMREPTFGGPKMEELSKDLGKAQDLIDAFYDNSFWLNEYVNRNTESVLKSLKTDKLPEVIVAKVLEFEKENHRRKDIIEFCEVFLG